MGDRTTFPAGAFRKIVPSDTVEFVPGRAIYVGVAGDVVAIGADGGEATFKNALGTIPIACKQIKATGTTATDIILLH